MTFLISGLCYFMNFNNVNKLFLGSNMVVGGNGWWHSTYDRSVLLSRDFRSRVKMGFQEYSMIVGIRLIEEW